MIRLYCTGCNKDLAIFTEHDSMTTEFKCRTLRIKINDEFGGKYEWSIRCSCNDVTPSFSNRIIGTSKPRPSANNGE